MKKAIITKVEKNNITLSFEADSMCGNCPTSSACLIKDCSKKNIKIKNNPNKNYELGDVLFVDVEAKSSFYALLFAYMLPLMILLIVFYGLKFFGFNEINCGTFAIMSLIPYYFCLFLLQEKINNKVEVKIYDN